MSIGFWQIAIVAVLVVLRTKKCNTLIAHAMKRCPKTYIMSIFKSVHHHHNIMNKISDYCIDCIDGMRWCYVRF